MLIQGQTSKKEPRKPSSSQGASNVDLARSIKNMETYSDKSNSNKSEAIPPSRNHHPAASGHRSTASPVHGSPTSSHASSDNGSVHQKPASLPKFGAWRKTDQKSESGYTVLFKGDKEKKQNAATYLRPVPTNATVSQQQKANQRRSSKKICCFFPRTRE